MTKILYYEIKDEHVANFGGKYFSWTNELRQEPHMVRYAAERIWEWNTNTDTVRFVKNIETGIMTPVKPGEFLMIQLRAEEILKWN